MMNVYNFENALKLSCIRKVIDQQSNVAFPWYKLLLSTTGNLENIKLLGGHWCTTVCQKFTIPFGIMFSHNGQISA